MLTTHPCRGAHFCRFRVWVSVNVRVLVSVRLKVVLTRLTIDVFDAVDEHLYVGG